MCSIGQGTCPLCGSRVDSVIDRCPDAQWLKGTKPSDTNAIFHCPHAEFICLNNFMIEVDKGVAEYEESGSGFSLRAAPEASQKPKFKWRNSLRGALKRDVEENPRRNVQIEADSDTLPRPRYTCDNDCWVLRKYIGDPAPATYLHFSDSPEWTEEVEDLRIVKD